MAMNKGPKAGQTLSLKGKNTAPMAKPQGKPKGSSDICGGPYDTKDTESKEQGGDEKPSGSDIVGGPYGKD